MIDHTSTRIEQQETALRRQNRRRYAFQRMLEATDRVLWQLEEMNRDGVKTVPPVVLTELREADELMPSNDPEPIKEPGHVLYAPARTIVVNTSQIPGRAPR